MGWLRVFDLVLGLTHIGAPAPGCKSSAAERSSNLGEAGVIPTAAAKQTLSKTRRDPKVEEA
jgi:hypothetical protein